MAMTTPVAEVSSEIGKRVRRYRDAKKLSQEALAHLAQVSHATVWRVETGRTAPDWGTLEALADALEVELIALLPSTIRYFQQMLADLAERGTDVLPQHRNRAKRAAS